MGDRLSGASKRPTIVDVARQAEVSTAAVSKVLRGAYGVSDDMRDRVGRAVEQLGYRPMAGARAMRGRTYTVGIVTSDVRNPFFGLILDGVISEVSGDSYDVLIGSGGMTAASQRRLADSMLDHRMDGLILVAPVASARDLDQLAASVPLVVVGRHGTSGRYDSIASDDATGSRLVVDHLAGLGHQRIVYNTHSTDLAPEFPETFRERGYRDAMATHGLVPDVIVGGWTGDGGRRVASEILDRAERPTAVYAGADVAAFGLLDELWRTDLAVPRDISIVGYDNTQMAHMAPIGLTSVEQGGGEMGRRGGRMLIERILGREDGVHQLIAPSLAVRTSSASPAG